MPCIIRRLQPDGSLIDVDYEANSLADAEHFEPAGSIYTVTNTIQRTCVLKLDHHFDRMETSAKGANISMHLNRQHVRNGLRRLIESSDFDDVRFRITVDPEIPDSFILSIEPYTPPHKHLLEQGVRCITAPNSARHDANVKSTDWMIKRKTIANAMPEGIYDTFLLDSDGYIMEGLGANFYAVIDGKLHTAGEGVLKGIAQQIILEVGHDILPIILQPPHIDQLPQFEEAFLSSSSRGIIPVVEIDGVKFGDGTPQPKTQQLIRAYRTWATTHMEDL